MNEERQIADSMNRLSYGLYLLASGDDARQNACIVNTVVQITGRPQRVSVAVSKENFTCDLIAKTGRFTVSVLSEAAPFALFEHFGFQSGRTVNKLDGSYDMPTAPNGICYLAAFTNAVLCGTVYQQIDCGTHILFLADVTDARVLSDAPSMTYAYYHAQVKPKPAVQRKKGFVCKICGYVYEGEELPADFVCPICKHPATDFEPIE